MLPLWPGQKCYELGIIRAMVTKFLEAIATCPGAIILYFYTSYHKEKPKESYTVRLNFKQNIYPEKKGEAFCSGCSISKPSFLVQPIQLSRPKMKIQIFLYHLRALP